MAFNVQHVRLLMTTSGKSLIWLGVGGMDALNLPVLPVSGLCPAMHVSQRFSTAPNSVILFPSSYLTRLKNKQVPVVLTQVGHLLHPISKYRFIISVYCCGFQRWIISSTVL